MLGKAMLATMLAFFVMQVGYIRYFQIYSGDRQGTGTKVQMASGSPVSGNLVKYDANGNVVDAGVQSGATGVPAGLIGFFAGACPSGWGEYTYAQGRYIVGVPNNGTVGLTQGTALSDGEARVAGAHSHGVTDPGHMHELNIGSDNLLRFGPGGGYTVSYITGGYYLNLQSLTPTNSRTTGITVQSAGTSTTPAPYIQLRACQKQ